MWTYCNLIAGAVRQMWRFRLRSGLVIICAALGVAGIITSVNYASSGRLQVLDQIRRMGTNVIMVTAQQSRTTAGRTRTGSIVTTLGQADYVLLRRDLPGQVRSSAIVTQAFRLKAGDFSKVAPIVGCEPSYFTIKSWPVEAGEIFETADLRRSARVVLIGHTVASDLYGTDSAVGQRLFINRIPFEVVGVLAERGQGLDIANEDEQVYIPLTTAMRRVLNLDYFNAIVFEIGDWNNMDASARTITDVLHVRHRTPATRRDDFQVQNQKELIDTQLASSARLAFFIRWIGVSGLAVSGMGVLAIAWITVRDRTTEIGTRRALGATASDVFFQFVLEASALGVMGSVGGFWLGRVTSQIAASRARLPFVFERPAAFIALATALVLNLVFAAWPASRAARLDPIQALKHE
ncbi:MAG TPA: ABC transporter permease [Vicinamibacterales bacterium]